MNPSDKTATYVHENLSVRDEDNVRVLTIDRQEKLGAFSSSLIAAIGAQVTRARESSHIRALVLTGTGRGFVAGADVQEYAHASLGDFENYQRRSRQVFDSLEQLPQVTIAAVNGFAFGGGFEIALCCDFIFASENARFALPEVKLGLFPGSGGPQRLSRQVGKRWTKELVMTGRTVYPAEALERGIVSRVVRPDALQEESLTFAAELAAQAPGAVRAAKRLIDSGYEKDLSAALTEDQIALTRLFSTDDAQEGIRAFLEKRKPAFRDN